MLLMFEFLLRQMAAFFLPVCYFISGGKFLVYGDIKFEVGQHVLICLD